MSLVFMIEFHKLFGTWKNKVDRFICLTDFSRDKFIEAGFPSEKISVKSNFTSIPASSSKCLIDTPYAVYVGRLSQEKGLGVLLKAWADVPINLIVVGEGPERIDNNCSRVEFVGCKSKNETLELIQGARFLVMPSVWYEMFGLVIIEAFSCSTPVIASDLGSISSLIDDGKTGFLFEPDNHIDLKSKIFRFLDNPSLSVSMGEAAKKVHLERFTGQVNYSLLSGIYNQVAENKV